MWVGIAIKWGNTLVSLENGYAYKENSQYFTTWHTYSGIPVAPLTDSSDPLHYRLHTTSDVSNHGLCRGRQGVLSPLVSYGKLTEIEVPYTFYAPIVIQPLCITATSIDPKTKAVYPVNMHK